LDVYLFCSGCIERCKSISRIQLAKVCSLLFSRDRNIFYLESQNPGKEKTLKKILLNLIRIAVLAIIFTVLFTFVSVLTTPPELAKTMSPEQVSKSAAMLPVVSTIMALWLVYLAFRSQWHGWKLVGGLFVIFFGLYSLLGFIELIFFPAVSNQMPQGMLTSLLSMGMILGISFSLLCVWIIGKTKKVNGSSSGQRLHMPPIEWSWKIISGAVLYVIVYFTFGYFVAWRTPGLPEFYGGTDPGTFLGQLINVLRDTPWLPLVQLFRGLIWVGIGIIMLQMHKGKDWELVLACGVTFTLIMNAPLLMPNPFMPPAVAHAHTIELVTSNLVYGILLSILLLWHLPIQMQTRKQPLVIH
jgi:hypothetical protein